MNRKQFWIRLSFYIVCGLLLPLAFLLWRFELLKSTPSATKLSGWGTIAVAFVVIFFIKLINSVKKGLKYSQSLQVMNGLTKVTLPLLLIAFCLKFMSNFVEQLFQFVIVLCACETIAYMVNPLKLWAIENNLEYEHEGFMESFKKFLNNEKK